MPFHFGTSFCWRIRFEVICKAANLALSFEGFRSLFVHPPFPSLRGATLGVEASRGASGGAYENGALFCIGFSGTQPSTNTAAVNGSRASPFVVRTYCPCCPIPH